MWNPEWKLAKFMTEFSIVEIHSKSESMKQVYNVDLSSSFCFPDSKKFKCPCKHIFAVFENTRADWSDLATNYRESSLYTTDKDVKGM